MRCCLGLKPPLSNSGYTAEDPAEPVPGDWAPAVALWRAVDERGSMLAVSDLTYVLSCAART